MDLAAVPDSGCGVWRDGPVSRGAGPWSPPARSNSHSGKGAEHVGWDWGRTPSPGFAQKPATTASPRAALTTMEKIGHKQLWPAVSTAGLAHRSIASLAQRAAERMSKSRSIAKSAICLRRSLISSRRFAPDGPSPS